MTSDSVFNPLANRTARMDAPVTFYIHDNVQAEMRAIQADVTQAKWLWAEVQQDFVWFSSANFRLKCVLYANTRFANAAFKVIAAYGPKNTDRSRNVRYSVQVVLAGKISFVSGGYENLPRNMNAQRLYNEIRKVYALHQESLREDKQARFDEQVVRQKERSWAEELKLLIDRQEDKNFEASARLFFPYHRMEPVTAHQVRGIRYAFECPDFIDTGEHTEIALSEQFMPGSYDNLIRGRLVSVEGTRVVLSFANAVDYGKFPKQGFLLVVPDPTVFRVQRRAVDALLAGTSANSSLLQYLVHGEYRPLRPSRVELTEGSYQPMQVEAIERAVSVEDFLLVQGPPGTGKTTIIVEMVRQFIRQGQRVLISSKNNLAVDNVLEQLLADDVDCIRIGREDKVKIASVRNVLLDRVAHQLQQNIVHRCSDNRRSVSMSVQEQRKFLQELEDAGPQIDEFRDKHLKTVALRQQRDRIVRYVQRKFWFAMALDKVLQAVGWLVRKPLHEAHQANWMGKRDELLAEHPDYPRICTEIDANQVNLDVQETALKHRLHNRLDPATPLASIVLEPRWSEWCQSQQKRLLNLESETDVITDWIEELEERQQSLYPLLVQSVSVVGATCIGIDTSPEFRDAEFDVVIVDEAGQITIFDVLVPMSKAKKVILIGDHQQLPPVADTDLVRECAEHGWNADLLEKSLFELLYHEAPAANKVMLDTQFRMHPVVAEFISQHFYDGKYKSGVGPAERTLKSSPYGSALVFVDTAHVPERIESVEALETHNVYLNGYEVKICTDAVLQLLRHGVRPKDIGIITPYKRQKDAILQGLQSFLHTASGVDRPDDVIRELEIDTVDSFQGRGKKVVLYSFTRSNFAGEIGFLRELRRLNVTMTRCKSLLVLIGDSSTLTRAKDGPSRRLFTSLIQYVKKHGQYIDASGLTEGGR